MNLPIKWNKELLMASPLFASLHPVLGCLEKNEFPSMVDLNALLDSRQSLITVQSGLPLRFVPQRSGRRVFDEQYEPRCYYKGEVQTREQNWHDLLNALVWLIFPKSKAAINARHFQALTQESHDPTSQRGAVRDMNTLFDESGVIVVCSNAELALLLRNFQWKELFWQRREQVKAQMGFYLFGHGLIEKALHPYIGLTGQGLVLGVEPCFFTWPLVRQLAHLDLLVADYLTLPEHCRSTRELNPVPLLGVPGWMKDNEREEFYEDTRYFRPGRNTKG
jgi:hypothetical protein